MTLWKQRLLARYHAPAGDDGAAGGSGSGEGGEGGEGNEGGEGEGEGSEGNDGAGDDGAAGDDKGKGKKSGISDADAKLLRENMKRKEDLRKANEDLAEARKALAKFDGLDADELRALVANKKAAEENQLAAKGEWDKLKERMAGEHQSAMTVVTTENESLKAANAKLAGQIEELTIGQSFAQSSFIKDETVLTPGKARKVYGEHFDVVDNEVVAFDKPRGAAGRTALVDQFGNHLPFEKAIEKLVDADTDAEAIRRSKMKQGAGSHSKGKQAPAQNQAPADSTSRIAAGLGSLFAPNK